MGQYKYTQEEFVKMLDEHDCVTWESYPISVQELVTLGLEGLNEVACDDIVEDGYKIEDISYTAKSIVDGQVIIEATGHAGTWKDELRLNNQD